MQPSSRESKNRVTIPLVLGKAAGTPCSPQSMIGHTFHRAHTPLHVVQPTAGLPSRRAPSGPPCAATRAPSRRGGDEGGSWRGHATAGRERARYATRSVRRRLSAAATSKRRGRASQPTSCRGDRTSRPWGVVWILKRSVARKKRATHACSSVSWCMRVRACPFRPKRRQNNAKNVKGGSCKEMGQGSAKRPPPARPSRPPAPPASAPGCRARRRPRARAPTGPPRRWRASGSGPRAAGVATGWGQRTGCQIVGFSLCGEWPGWAPKPCPGPSHKQGATPRREPLPPHTCSTAASWISLAP